jgi:outer membrane protein TolC
MKPNAPEAARRRIRFLAVFLALSARAAALHEARGMFLPSVGIEARYTRAGGGRVIDLPIGDLMNPVYGTLNTLPEAFGQPAPFPENLPNQRIPFLREREQETKVRVIRPLFQPALAQLVRMRGAARDIASLSRDAIARAAKWPGVSAVFDHGTWDETYRFGPDNEFWTASVAASWNLFNGFQDRHRAEQALLEKKEREAEALRGRILMQARDAREVLHAALQAFAAASDRLAAERMSFGPVDRRYREGLSPQIEFLAAWNALTRAEMNAAVCEADCRVREAEFECAAALRP